VAVQRFIAIVAELGVVGIAATSKNPYFADGYKQFRLPNYQWTAVTQLFADRRLKSRDHQVPDPNKPKDGAVHNSPVFHRLAGSEASPYNRRFMPGMTFLSCRLFNRRTAQVWR